MAAAKTWYVAITYFEGEDEEWEVWASEGRLGPGAPAGVNTKYFVASHKELAVALDTLCGLLGVAKEHPYGRGH